MPDGHHLRDPHSGLTTRRAALGLTAAATAGLLADRALSPLSAQALEESEPINVKNYGAKGDGSTDDTNAILAAMAALPPHGGTILFPPGAYQFSSTLSFDNTNSVRLVGCGGGSAGVLASVLRFTAAGVGPAVSARSSSGFSIADLGLTYTNGGFTGTVLDLSATGTLGSATGRGPDTSLVTIERCYVGGYPRSAAAALCLENAIIVTVIGGNISGANVGVLGRTSASNHSNVVRFIGTQFVGNSIIHLRNAGAAWSFLGCTFENLSDGSAGAYGYEPGIFSQGMDFTACWFGDITTSGIQVDWGGSALNMSANMISGQKNADTVGVRISAAGSHGITIKGNLFSSLGVAIQVPAAGAAYLDLLGNDFQAVGTQIEGPFEPAGYALLPNAGGRGLEIHGANLAISSPGHGLVIKEGTNTKQGVTRHMSRGKVAVRNTAVTAQSRIFLTRQFGGRNAGSVYVGSLTAGQGFEVKSTNPADSGIVAYQIFEPG